MNIILLSGGSGKRLWPLSNDVRSKQFIKLFKNNDAYESMVQRVYRQITTVDANAKITIATSKSQASAIKNQLGEKASICVEPCRRDTFPAIALAAAYLHDELGVDENEAVVVCPVDPYVDNTYYEAVKTLQELAEQGGSNLTLMGIEPTYPSEKYGYIIPESGENVSKVKEFKEKPDVETAKKYLAQSALWNAGIFAFKLGYLLDKAHSMIDFEDYRDLFNKYDTLTKISFDYAVVEKESSIQVLRYSGDWKDVGTWNMMAEVMADKTKGKAILDETCENTNVVNELNIPILCMGCKDMIVAASGDGILIADKERSGYMKPYVEKIETEAMYAEKSWGTYTVIDVQPGSMTVKISMRAGEHMSYHMHNYREEVWTVVSGKGKAKNFDLPYLAKNPSDFWRRWHISLSSWFRDYVYIPLGGGRAGKGKTYRNLFVTMLLSGIWHGANWTFIVWGVLHGVGSAVHKIFRDIKGKADKRTNPVVSFICIVGNCIFVALLWVVFRAADMGQVMEVLSGLFRMTGITYINVYVVIYFVIIAVVHILGVIKNNGHAFEVKLDLDTFKGQIILFTWIFLIIAFMYVGDSAFIYAQF